MSEHGEEHIGLLGYGLVFSYLFVMTIVTYIVAFWDLEVYFAGANTLLALLIAFSKMMAVVLFFMHVWWSSKLVKLSAIAGFFWLAIMFAFTLQDYLTRSITGN